MVIQRENNASQGRSLERGEFRDGLRTYRVRVSSNEAPDSFQVYTGASEDIVLIVSGINSGNLKATWGPGWRGAEKDWKVWVEECAFRLVIVGRHMIERNPASVRFCDG